MSGQVLGDEDIAGEELAFVAAGNLNFAAAGQKDYILWRGAVW